MNQIADLYLVYLRSFYLSLLFGVIHLRITVNDWNNKWLNQGKENFE